MSLPVSSPAAAGLTISWVLSTISGYGVYGLQILLQYMRRGGGNIVLPQSTSVIEMPGLAAAKLAPVLELARKVADYRKQHPDELLAFRHPALHGSSSDFAGFAGQDRIWGQPNVACCAIEHLVCSDYGRGISKNYDMFIAISRWNADYLNSLNLHGPVHLCHQGIDPTLFTPGPRSGLYGDRFVIFSGGKFEYRKGQDIVVKAFKIFHARHAEALLVTCWQNLLPPDVQSFALAGHVAGVPDVAANFGLLLTPWLLKQGLPAGSFIDLPFTYNLLMPYVLRECDMAVFPNRCEGGTNLVAMEAMACGVPTYVSYNTGQKDIVDLMGAEGLMRQGAVKAPAATPTVQDWGESDVEEVVEAMERVFTQRQEAAAKAARVAMGMNQWHWGPLNDQLLDAVGAAKQGES